MDRILRGEPVQRERLSLSKLVVEVRLDFLHLLREKGIDLLVDVAKRDRDVAVFGHRELLRQAIGNLIDNAIKYALSNSTIEMRCIVRTEGPCLEISNQGLSIPGEDQEKIFQRGFRSASARALVPHGSGLGLWWVRKIVEAHGASIRYYEIGNANHKRNVFRIMFPCPKS